MKPNLTIGGTCTPIWFKRLRNVLPLSMGILFAMSSVNAAYAAQPNEVSEPTSINQTKGTVSGRITDNTGEGLVGVTIVVKGTKVRATTAPNGNFSIKANAGQTLVISYIGYKRVEKKVTGSKMNVELEAIDNTLNEAVVIGYGTVRKADLAGAVAVMDNKSFKDQPITQVSDALQGRVSGVQVISDGTPGGDVKIRIRGTNSINKSNEPLYVVDGMVRENGLDGLNPEDIQSLQILKDASSTAIYGSRGANGVVIVTTKTGKAGQSNITFDGSWGFSKAVNMPKMMGTKEYAEALVKYAGISQNKMQEYINGTNPGIRWDDILLRNGFTQNYKVVFDKGTEDLQAYISGSYMKHEGVIKTQQYERYSAKANVKAHMKSWLDVTLDVNASRGIGKGGGGFGASASNPLWIAYNSSPTMVMKDENGYYNTDEYGTIQKNAYGTLKENKNEHRHDVLNGHIDLRFNILPGLTFTTSNGIDYFNNTYYSIMSEKVQGAGQNSIENANRQRVNLQSTNNITYTHTWNEKHHLTATGVWEATKSNSRYMRIKGETLSTESVGWWNIDVANTKTGYNGYSDWALLSGVGRVMYNFADKYMLTGTFRADGSSRFTNKKWGYFPSIAAAWTVSQEEFMKNVKPISNLKVRVSYGVIGNQDIDPYSTLATLSSTTTYYGDNKAVNGFIATNLATPDLKWEKTKQFDLGVDLGFFENRLTLSVDYFNKHTEDALLWTNLPNYLGGTRYMINAGKVKNTGVDITLGARIIQNRDWSWTTSLNGTYLKNEVVKLTADKPAIYGSNLGSILPENGVTVIKEGEAIGSFYGYKWAGIDADGYDTFYTADGSITRKPNASKDKQILGKSTPDFTLGWNNTITYKNWSLNAFFNSAFGVQRANLLRYAMNTKLGNSRFVTDADYFKNMGSTMANLSVPDNETLTLGASSKFIENASYFRCENVTLGYDLPKSVAKIADFHFSFSVQNLFTITKYKGQNPAGFSFHGDGGENNAGLDMGTFPMPRTFTLGVRMTF